MAAFIGIDLGTTFSAVARIDDIGAPAIVHNLEGKNVTPSVVEFRSDGVVEVGELPRKNLGLEDNVFGGFKRDMGTDTTYEVNGESYTPIQFSTFVLKKLKQDAEEALGPIGEAIVTIPANFPHEARTATMAAAKAARLKIRHIINEPTAAALYYAYKNGKEFDGCCAIYDLGGGTFDVTIATVVGQDVEVLATEGLKNLGGGDFDMELQRLVTIKYKDETGKEPAARDFTLNDAEELKKSLSKREKATARVGLEVIEVSREEFEEAISTLIAKTEMLCQSALDEAGVSVNEIQHVLFAGGSTRVPVVVESAKKLFQQEPVSTANVDEVVAMGAALYAIYKGDQTDLNAAQKNSVEKMQIQERTGKYFGTLAIAALSQEMENIVIIPKGEKIPCQVEKSLYTVHEDQESVRCEVTESGALEKVPDFVKIIWEGDLPLPSGRPANQEIKVKFSYDDSQIMQCEFVDVQTGKETKVELTVSADPSRDQEVDKFLVT
jgi:molecular chaperone DnaK